MRRPLTCQGIGDAGEVVGSDWLLVAGCWLLRLTIVRFKINNHPDKIEKIYNYETIMTNFVEKTLILTDFQTFIQTY
ncbi:MAG: hypothetical protein IPM34_04110 [Saprospiraceae bacterium]|nr:hypothetical protein [Saprospiraceae bacterium]